VCLHLKSSHLETYSMVGVMQVDTAPRWWFLLIAVVASAFLLAALILGATGTARTLLFHGPIYSLL
jgi:hypothetical protein